MFASSVDELVLGLPPIFKVLVEQRKSEKKKVLVEQRKSDKKISVRSGTHHHFVYGR